MTARPIGQTTTTTVKPVTELKTHREAAEYLGIAEQTLHNWRATGRVRIPFVRVGRLVKYLRTDLDQFLERQRVDD
jgi:excisionase family DNA binding protein